MGSRLAHLRCLQITQPTTNVELGFNPLCKNLKCPNMFSSISIKAINCLLLSFMRYKILNKLYGLSIRFQHIDTKFGLRRISSIDYLPLIGCLHLMSHHNLPKCIFSLIGPLIHWILTNLRRWR